MTHHCRVASVIVCYHDAPAVARLCATLLEESAADDAIVVIDHSSDEYRSTRASDFRDVAERAAELILETANRGSAGGFRRGQEWALARGAAFVWLHDQDGEPRVGCLEALLAAIGVRGSIAAAAPVVLDEDGLPQREFCAMRGVLGLPRFVQPPIRGRTASAAFVASAGVLLRATAVAAIGPYDDEHYFVGYEDFDFCARLSHAGAQIVVSGSAHYRHPHLLRKRGHPWPDHPGAAWGWAGAIVRYLGVVNLRLLITDAQSSRSPTALASFRFFATARARPIAWRACVAYSLLRASAHDRAALQAALDALDTHADRD